MAGISLGSVLNQTAPTQEGTGSSSGLGQVRQAPAAIPAGKSVGVTAAAARQARSIMEKDGLDPATVWLRLGVKGGGCSGLAYQIDVSHHKDVMDVEFEVHGIRVLVDRKSLIYLAGTELDFGAGLKAGWQFNNPNQKKGCSCGESFSV